MILKACFLLLFVWAAASVEGSQQPREERSTNSLLIGAFNVQIFGKSKMSDPQVVDVLVDIVLRYDLILIQEIRDIDEVAFPQLVDDVNAASPNEPYACILGPREGRTSSKEQYGFIYKANVLTAKLRYLYDDVKDEFEREPYVVQFERLTSGNQQFFNFIPLHAKPDDAVEELTALVNVYDDSLEQTDIADAFIGGDLNADCNYVCSSCWSEVGLRNDPRFLWMTPDTADTTTTKTDCAYDRVVVAGNGMWANSHDARVFHFDQEFNLDSELTNEVSDHYPVEFYLD